MINKNITLKIQEWMSDSYDLETRDEIQKLIDEKNETELEDRFYKDLEFGTGGLRGIIGAGTNRMNIYTVGKAAQGIANYIIKNDPDAKTNGIVIACDSREYSDIFSLHSALIFAANGIKAYLFKTIHPTPILSFAIRHLKAIAGIVVTASHNPPEYNGYKVYYSDGSQVLPPHDQGIMDEVKSISNVKEIRMITENDAILQNRLDYIGKEVDEAYYKKVLALRVNQDIVSQLSDQLKIVFTPLHGTGNVPVREALKRWGFRQVAVVPEQEAPDGKFPTVSYPNPEESAALKLAIAQAKASNADLVLATDPDADRVGIAVNNGNNEFTLMNGNQVGVLLSYYLLSEYHKKGKLPNNSYIVKTIVSTDLINPICEKYNVTLAETLTGFKYIAQKIELWHDKNFIIGFEESYGYNAGEFVRDKDAVSTCCLIAEVAALCKSMNKTLLQYLDDIYQQFGYYLESLESLTLKGKKGVEAIETIMNYFRNTPPHSIANSPVIKIRDVKRGTIIDVCTNQESKLDLPESNVLTYYLENGGKVTLRPSGTEPKIKFYLSCYQKGDEQSLDAVKLAVKKQLSELSKSFISTIQKII